MVQGIQLNIIRDGGCAICKNFIKSARNVTLTLNLSLTPALTPTTTAIMHCVLIMDAEGILEGGGRPGFGRWSNFYVAAGSPLSSTRWTPHASSHWLKDAKSLSNGFRISFDRRHGPKLIRFRISLCLFLRRLLCRPARRHAPPPPALRVAAVFQAATEGGVAAGGAPPVPGAAPTRRPAAHHRLQRPPAQGVGLRRAELQPRGVCAPPPGGTVC